MDITSGPWTQEPGCLAQHSTQHPAWSEDHRLLRPRGWPHGCPWGPTQTRRCEVARADQERCAAGQFPSRPRAPPPGSCLPRSHFDFSSPSQDFSRSCLGLIRSRWFEPPAREWPQQPKGVWIRDKQVTLKTLVPALGSVSGTSLTQTCVNSAHRFPRHLSQIPKRRGFHTSSQDSLSIMPLVKSSLKRILNLKCKLQTTADGRTEFFVRANQQRY